MCIRDRDMREVATQLDINVSTARAILKTFRNEGRIGKGKQNKKKVGLLVPSNRSLYTNSSVPLIPSFNCTSFTPIPTQVNQQPWTSSGLTNPQLYQGIPLMKLPCVSNSTGCPPICSCGLKMVPNINMGCIKNPLVLQKPLFHPAVPLFQQNSIQSFKSSQFSNGFMPQAMTRLPSSCLLYTSPSPRDS
eukprot:TRINITY_DN1764_c0_g1_i6.p1 TRINITY_DN1764_c0_g1~~TRINITY_DN1764_c0_g1_i6.p1  ORF type:complete len:190 (+),score=14.04 TRINITY_DN1764_c0_g1_i6:64-633(+)